MIQKKTIEFNNEEEVLDFYRKLPHFEQCAILGGHFILDIDKEENKLKPLIKNSDNTELFNKVADIEAGDFPIKSFQLALSLQENMLYSKLFLLVNDHKIPSLYFSGLKDRLPLLRRQYYQQENTIPKKYLKLLGNKKVDDIFLANNQKRGIDEILASETYLFSEYVYRKKFDRSLKKEMFSLNAFTPIERNGGKQDVYFTNALNESFCVLEEGKCGCSGEIMQVIVDFNERFGQQNFLLIVPNECANAVTGGVEAVQYFLDKTQNIKVNIDVLSGFEYEKHRSLFFKKITLKQLRNG